MSYFGTQLDELLKRKKMKAVDLARASGVIPSTISKYRSGDHTWLSMQDLSSIASSISSDPAEQAMLVRAHLLDECKGPGSELISINVADAAEIREHPAQYFRLPPDLEEAFRVLREIAKQDTQLAVVLKDLADLVQGPSQEERMNAGRKGQTKYPAPVPGYSVMSEKPAEDPSSGILDALDQTYQGDKSPKNKKPGSAPPRSVSPGARKKRARKNPEAGA